MRWLAMIVILGMCSEPEPDPPVVEPVSDEEEPAPEPEPTAPPSEQEDDAPRALELPDPVPSLEQLRSRRASESSDYGEAVWPEIQHPDAEVRRALASVVAGLARQLVDRDIYPPNCEAHLATERLISVGCLASYDVRGGLLTTRLAASYAVVGDELIPVTVEQALLPGVDLRGELTARCEARRAAVVARLGDPQSEDYEITDESWMQFEACTETSEPALHFGPDGLIGLFDFYNAHVLEARIPWSELRGQIRADGPLAPVLADGTFTPARVTEDEANAWAVTGFGLEEDLVARWRPLDTDAPVGLDRFGGGLARLVVAGESRERAAEVARGLGATVQPVVLDTPDGRAPELAWDGDGELAERDGSHWLPLRWVRTNEDLNLRRGRDWGRVFAVLPAGSLVPALGGALGRRGEFVEVVTPLGRGFLASRYLRRSEGCVPEAARAQDARLVARTRIRSAGRVREAWLTVEAGVSRGRVTLLELGEGCAFGDEIDAFDVSGRPFDVRLTGTTEHGGSTIVVIGATRRGEEELRFVAYRVGTSEPVLEETAAMSPSDTGHRVRLSEAVDGSYFPVTFQGAGRTVRRFTWSGERLVEASPE